MWELVDGIGTPNPRVFKSSTVVLIEGGKRTDKINASLPY